VVITATVESAVTRFLMVSFPDFFMMALSYKDIQGKKKASQNRVSLTTHDL